MKSVSGREFAKCLSVTDGSCYGFRAAIMFKENKEAMYAYPFRFNGNHAMKMVYSSI